MIVTPGINLLCYVRTAYFNVFNFRNNVLKCFKTFTLFQVQAFVQYYAGAATRAVCPCKSQWSCSVYV